MIPDHPQTRGHGSESAIQYLRRQKRLQDDHVIVTEHRTTQIFRDFTKVDVKDSSCIDENGDIDPLLPLREPLNRLASKIPNKEFQKPQDVPKSVKAFCVSVEEDRRKAISQSPADRYMGTMIDNPFPSSAQPKYAMLTARAIKKSHNLRQGKNALPTKYSQLSGKGKFSVLSSVVVDSEEEKKVDEEQVLDMKVTYTKREQDNVKASHKARTSDMAPFLEYANCKTEDHPVLDMWEKSCREIFANLPRPPITPMRSRARSPDPVPQRQSTLQQVNNARLFDSQEYSRISNDIRNQSDEINSLYGFNPHSATSSSAARPSTIPFSAHYKVNRPELSTFANRIQPTSAAYESINLAINHDHVANSRECFSPTPIYSPMSGNTRALDRFAVQQYQYDQPHFSEHDLQGEVNQQWHGHSATTPEPCLEPIPFGSPPSHRQKDSGYDEWRKRPGAYDLQHKNEGDEYKHVSPYTPSAFVGPDGGDSTYPANAPVGSHVSDHHDRHDFAPASVYHSKETYHMPDQMISNPLTAPPHFNDGQDDVNPSCKFYQPQIPPEDANLEHSMPYHFTPADQQDFCDILLPPDSTQRLDHAFTSPLIQQEVHNDYANYRYHDFGVSSPRPAFNDAMMPTSSSSSADNNLNILDEPGPIGKFLPSSAQKPAKRAKLSIPNRPRIIPQSLESIVQNSIPTKTIDNTRKSTPRKKGSARPPELSDFFSLNGYFDLQQRKDLISKPEPYPQHRNVSRSSPEDGGIDWTTDPCIKNPKWYRQASTFSSIPHEQPIPILATMTVLQNIPVARALQMEGFVLVEQEKKMHSTDIVLSQSTAIMLRDLSKLPREQDDLIQEFKNAAKNFKRVIVIFETIAYSASAKFKDAKKNKDPLDHQVRTALAAIKRLTPIALNSVGGFVGQVESVFAYDGAEEVAKVLGWLFEEDAKALSKKNKKAYKRLYGDRKWLEEEPVQEDLDLLTTHFGLNIFCAWYALVQYGSTKHIIIEMDDEARRKAFGSMFGDTILDRLNEIIQNKKQMFSRD
ncbi:uncharacterized protein L201_003623 [Kwoniella dendrophila CBS 6074]|uniref:ERCC4 domain-containing protein n=1 Tax=Kwoniella dendrophila CBS 6074 TaxID=1295534 RepID=A0AAX4JW35_9TREE